MVFDCPSLSTCPQVWQWRDDAQWHPQSRCTGGWGIWDPHSWFDGHTADLLCEWACFCYLFQLLQCVPMVFPYAEGTHMAHYLWDVYLRLLFGQQLQDFLDLSIFYPEALGPAPHVCWSVDKDSLTGCGLGLETLFVSSKSDKICDLDIKLENFWWYYWVVKHAALLSHQFSQFSSVIQSCLTLCDPMNCSTPGLPVHYQPPEFTQTHVHRVSDACQPMVELKSSIIPFLNFTGDCETV